MITTPARRNCHPADLENRKTHEAAHNDRPISDILAEFSAARLRIVERLARMTPAELARTALHPRLRQPMSVVDLCFFVAEHDDHHLRTIEKLRSDSD
jgi:DinB superfamily